MGPTGIGPFSPGLDQDRRDRAMPPGYDIILPRPDRVTSGQISVIDDRRAPPFQIREPVAHGLDLGG